jgi:hypothetical protein
MYGSFNANEVQPRMGGGGSHPVGIFMATISNAEIKPTKNNDGGFYEVTFKTNAGEIATRFNLWNQGEHAETTVRIARENLSALCHAIVFYNINFDADGGRSLINAPLMIEVGPQLVNSDPNDKKSKKVESPNLREVKRFFSKEGRNPSSPGDAPVMPTEGDSGATQGGPPALPAFPTNAAPPAAAAAPTPAPAPAASGPSWAQPGGAAPAAGAAPGVGQKPPWAQ